MTTGIVVPNSEKIQRFSDLDALFSTYQNAIVRPTASPHGKQLADRYETFVRNHNDPLNIPFLIPEFRYGGLDRDHRHRLDFTVLSAEKNLATGFEMSPWSTHGRVIGIKAKREQGGEAALEKERMEKFDKEMQKRNDYFRDFGVTVLTYTDVQLVDPDTVFESVKTYLEPATKDIVSAPAVKEALYDPFLDD